MKVSFRIVKRLTPLLLRDYKESNTGWLKCQVYITQCSVKRHERTYCLFQGKLPSCAPYFVFTTSANFMEGRRQPTIAPANANVSYLHGDAQNVSRADKDFMIEEVGYAHPGLSMEKLAELRGTISRVYQSKELRDNELFFNACDYFRVGHERVVRKYFPRQLEAVQKLSVDRLKKCINFLSTKPHLLMFPKWSWEMFGLRPLAYAQYREAVVQYTARPDKTIQVATSFYAFISGKLHGKEGHTLFDRNKVVQQYLATGSNLFDQRYLDPALVFLEYKAIVFIDARRLQFVLKRDLPIVQQVCDALIEIRGNPNPPTMCGLGDDAERACIKCFPLTDEQESATSHVFGSWLTVILGGPGHGKSEGIVQLVKTFKNILVVTYVGMAVDMLKSRVNGYEHVYTIHYVYYRALHSESGAEWIAQFDVVVFDETSNIDVYLFKMILSVLQRGICRLILVGDTGQINPIDPGNPFRDVIEAFPQHVFHFSENMRVAADSRMLADVSGLINRNLLDDIDLGQPCLQMVERTSIERVMQPFIARYAYEMMNIQVLCLRNDVRREINVAVETALQEMGVLSSDRRGARRIRYNFWLYPGKKITFTKNYKSYTVGKTTYDGVRNGELDEVGKIQVAQPNTIVTLRHSKKRVLIGDASGAVHPSDVQLGYAVTCNKAQGSEWEKVVFYIHPGVESFWSREYAYVAVSRAKRSCAIVGTMDELKLICRNRANHRETALARMLETTMTDIDSIDGTTDSF